MVSIDFKKGIRYGSYELHQDTRKLAKIIGMKVISRGQETNLV